MSLVVALVGTDHHPFDRLVDWLDETAVRHPDVRVVVQYGASRAPLVAEGRDYIPHQEIVRLLDEATAVVCHGGPGTIMDARGAGHVPICVPRDPARGEHVDGHQQRFAAVVGAEGVVAVAESAETFHEMLAARVASGRRAADTGEPSSTEVARRRIAEGLDELISTHGARRRRTLLGRRR